MKEVLARIRSKTEKKEYRWNKGCTVASSCLGGIFWVRRAWSFVSSLSGLELEKTELRVSSLTEALKLGPQKLLSHKGKLEIQYLEGKLPIYKWKEKKKRLQKLYAQRLTLMYIFILNSKYLGDLKKCKLKIWLVCSYLEHQVRQTQIHSGGTSPHLRTRRISANEVPSKMVISQWKIIKITTNKTHRDPAKRTERRSAKPLDSGIIRNSTYKDLTDLKKREAWN